MLLLSVRLYHSSSTKNIYDMLASHKQPLQAINPPAPSPQSRPTHSRRQQAVLCSERGAMAGAKYQLAGAGSPHAPDDSPRALAPKAVEQRLNALLRVVAPMISGKWRLMVSRCV